VGFAHCASKPRIVRQFKPCSSGRRRWSCGGDLPQKSSFATETKVSFIVSRVWLGHHYARIALKVPMKLGVKKLDVLCGPEDFALNRI